MCLFLYKKIILCIYKNILYISYVYERLCRRRVCEGVHDNQIDYIELEAHALNMIFIFFRVVYTAAVLIGGRDKTKRSGNFVVKKCSSNVP